MKCTKCGNESPELKYRSLDNKLVCNLEQIKNKPSQLWQPINENGFPVGEPLILEDICNG